MKKIIVFVILVCIFSLPVYATDNYATHIENVGADTLEDILDNNTRSFFEENGIDITNSTWVGRLTEGDVLQHLWQFVTDGAKTPIMTGTIIAGIIFVTAAITSFGANSRFDTAVYAAVLSICAVTATSVWQSMSAAVNAVKGCSTFMLGFVPIFSTTVALSGKTVTASSMSALLLIATETVSFVSSFAVLPLMGGYLALSISSGVSPLLNGSGIVESVKKISVWILSLLGTLFIGILGIQTAVNSAADSVSLRAAKFIIGTSVPVAGGVLSEAISTISTSMGLLKSSVGIYGVVALVVMLLPIVIELILWRCVLFVNISFGELFSLSKTAGVLRAIDSMLSILLGIILMVGGMFIIALSVVVMSTK